METLIYFIYFISVLFIAYTVGVIVESSHYADIKKRELELVNLPAVTSKSIEAKESIVNAELVMGSVVISLDHFKRFLAALRNIVGGRIKSYETLLDRGRREAILRMKQKAQSIGADMVLNMRFQTSSIGQVTANKNSIGCFEVIAYGTAVKLRK